MKKIFIIFLFSFFCFTTATQAKSPIGMGVMLGEPTGFNAKLWLGKTMAVDGGVGYSFLGEDGLQLHGDYLYHLFEIISVRNAEMPLYIGVGGRVKFQDNDNRFGIRFPIGLSYIMERPSMDIFIEPAPVLDLAPDAELEFNGVVGVRYWF